ncbi:MAG: replication-associated recombination protein A [Phycisphaerae bacterium]
MADLFGDQRREHRRRVTPLAVRMRPTTLDGFVGQEHFVGTGKLLRRMLQSDRLTSAVFYGPSGTGKTTLAHIIAGLTRSQFVEVNAAAIGVAQVRRILAQAADRLDTAGQRTVLFIDELHRFNRAQQDVLLGDVENGLIILLGATTQNPFFAINGPLLSRSQIFEFKTLTEDEILGLLRRAVTDKDNGLGDYRVELTDQAARHLAVTCDGDARRALTALEVAVLSQVQSESPHAVIAVDLNAAADSIQRKVVQYDGTGDEHYDAASAFIKSIRGSDPDAAVYWLARMLEAGEDPRFIARRVVIAAAEDVGNADPQALILAQAAAEATAFIGLPECQLPLAQAVIYLSCAPKSNASAKAIWQASKDVRQGRTLPVPHHLRDAHYAGAKQLGHGQGYQYPHDDPRAAMDQDYLGPEKNYYLPTGDGAEKKMDEYLKSMRRPRQAREARSTEAS